MEFENLQGSKGCGAENFSEIKTNEMRLLGELEMENPGSQKL
jgi:hypothetical protein